MTIHRGLVLICALVLPCLTGCTFVRTSRPGPPGKPVVHHHPRTPRVYQVRPRQHPSDCTCELCHDHDRPVKGPPPHAPAHGVRSKHRGSEPAHDADHDDHHHGPKGDDHPHANGNDKHKDDKGKSKGKAKGHDKHDDDKHDNKDDD